MIPVGVVVAVSEVALGLALLVVAVETVEPDSVDATVVGQVEVGDRAVRKGESEDNFLAFSALVLLSCSIGSSLLAVSNIPSLKDPFVPIELSNPEPPLLTLPLCMLLWCPLREDSPVAIDV